MTEVKRNDVILISLCMCVGFEKIVSSISKFCRFQWPLDVTIFCF